MLTPTTIEEQRAFCQMIMPTFVDYLRTHQTAIEQVELAVTREGVVSFPATQILGGVQKTVRVPLSLLTQEIDADLETVREMSDYAKAQGDYAKAQAAAVNTAAAYAEEQGDYAKAQGQSLNGIRSTIESWFSPFRDEVEDWYADAASAEQQRAAAEIIRQNQESSRVSAEAQRVAAELLRVAAENDRAAAELDRAAAELERVRVELLRVSAENARAQAETARETAEQTRENQEDARELAESQRQSTFTQNEAQRQDDFEAAESARDQIAATVAAQGNEAERKGNVAYSKAMMAKFYSDYQPVIGKTLEGHSANDNYWWFPVPNADYTVATYVNSNVWAKGEDLDWSTVSEEDKRRIVESMLSALIEVSEQDAAAIWSDYVFTTND